MDEFAGNVVAVTGRRLVVDGGLSALVRQLQS